jgi:chitinase
MSRKLLFALLLLIPCLAEAQQYRVIAYVRPRTDFDKIGAHKLTHINYAFAKVSTTGEVVLPDDKTAERLRELLPIRKRNPRLKILLAVGGWGADNFSDAALTGASRRKFAETAAKLVDRYTLDGLDIDWEYPGQSNGGIKSRPEDRQNFTLLLQALRERLDALGKEKGRSGADRYLLTIATTGGRYFDLTQMYKLHEYVDWMNMMTYDFYGEGTTTTGHHTALLRNPWSQYRVSSADAMMRQHLREGIPKDKLVIGVALYGRRWTGVGPKGNGLFQEYERYVDEISYWDIAANYINKKGFKRIWDYTARAAYLWNAETRTFISYDDPESVRAKAEFVKEFKLGGVMYWEHSHDPEEILLNVLRDSLSAR